MHNRGRLVHGGYGYEHLSSFLSWPFLASMHLPMLQPHLLIHSLTDWLLYRLRRASNNRSFIFVNTNHLCMCLVSFPRDLQLREWSPQAVEKKRRKRSWAGKTSFQPSAWIDDEILMRSGKVMYSLPPFSLISRSKTTFPSHKWRVFSIIAFAIRRYHMYSKASIASAVVRMQSKVIYTYVQYLTAQKLLILWYLMACIVLYISEALGKFHCMSSMSDYWYISIGAIQKLFQGLVDVIQDMRVCTIQYTANSPSRCCGNWNFPQRKSKYCFN